MIHRQIWKPAKAFKNSDDRNWAIVLKHPFEFKKSTNSLSIHINGGVDSICTVFGQTKAVRTDTLTGPLLYRLANWPPLVAFFEKWTKGQTNRIMDEWTNKQANRIMNERTKKQTGIIMDERTNKQTKGRTDRVRKF